MDAERRESSRIALGEVGARLLAPAALQGARVVELSAGGVGLVLPPGCWPTFAESPLVLELPGAGRVELLARPVRAAPLADGLRVGLCCDLPDEGGLGRLSAFLASRYQEAGRDRDLDRDARERSLGVTRRDLVIRSLSHHLLGLGAPLWAYRGAVALPGLLRARSFDASAGRSLLEVEASEGLAALLPERGEVVLAFSAYRAVAYFESEVFRRAGDRLWLTLPAAVRQTGFRSSARLALPAVGQLGLEIAHPRLPGLRLEKPVLELSARGLSFPFEPLEDRLFPGERLGELVLTLPGGAVRATAVVRSMRCETPGPLICGLELTGFESPAGAEAWGRLVFQLSHPALVLGRGELLEDTWDVLVRSQYPEEVVEALRPKLAERFRAAWGSMADDARQGRFVLIEKQGRVVGTAAANLLYPRTWFFHHMGFDAVERRADRQGLFELAHEVYVGMCHLMNHMNPVDFWAIFAEAGRPWNDMLYAQFVLRHPQQDDVLYDGYGVYRWLPGPRPALDAARLGGVRVVRPDEAQRARLVDHLLLSTSRVEQQAYAYAEDLELEAFGRGCAGMGYERSRGVYLAVEEGRPRAALLAETGGQGVNLFGLLNRCWLVMLEPDAARDDRVKLALLDQAIRHYAERGREDFLYLGHWGGEPMDLLEPLGFKFEAEGFRFLARRAVLPAYMAYVDELMRMIRG